MALGLSSAEANEILDAWGNGGSLTPPSNFWIKLHTADPGSAGTTAAATETTRKEVTWSAAAGGVLSNDAELSWTNVAGSEDYTHFSVWTASTGGTFLGSGTVTADAVTAGNTFTIAIGGLDFTLNVAA